MTGLVVVICAVGTGLIVTISLSAGRIVEALAVFADTVATAADHTSAAVDEAAHDLHKELVGLRDDVEADRG